MRRFLLGLVLLAGITGCTNVSGIAMPDGQNRVVDIVNDTGTPVAQFYGVAKGRGHDQIGNVPIAPRGYVSLNFDDGTGACEFRFFADFDGNQEPATTEINVCEQSVWRIH